MPKLLGIDVGTTSVKARVIGDDGATLGGAERDYAFATPAPEHVEFDAEEYWASFSDTVRRAVRAVGGGRDITALAIATQGETIVPVDRDGNATRPAIVWLDNRAHLEASAIAARFGEDEIYAHTGQPQVVATWPACKILWTREHEPDVFARTSMFHLLEDFFIRRLTGSVVGSRCLHSSSLLLDIRRGIWWDAMVAAVGIGESALPSLVDAGEIVGTVRPTVADELGLSRDTAVVAAGLDQAVAAFGAGTRVGEVSEVTGSALAITAPVAELTLDGERRLPCHVYAERSTFCLLSWAPTAGVLLRWARDELFGPDVAYTTLDAAATQVEPGSNALLALPHFEGAACPEFEPRARGALVGLTLRHTRAHIVRALMEAVAYELRANVELIEQVGGEIEELRSSGGGSRSRLWLQIKADVLRKPIVAIDDAETGCLGAAALAGVATGSFTADDVLGLAGAHLRIEPDDRHVSLYDERFHSYRELNDALTPLFKGGATA